MSTSAPIPHRSISSIRGDSSTSANPRGPSSPHTPLRPITSSAFGSPSSLRADEDIIVFELGARNLRVGFAGDPIPKRVVTVGPEDRRRVGDFRAWESGYGDGWRQGRDTDETKWSAEREWWQLDCRGQDPQLVGDRIERGLRETFTRYLLIDSKPRRFSLILSPAMPIPLLSAVLDTIFNRFSAPTVSLFSSPVSAVMAAGLRSGLVVDLGWNETVVTGVYEYREVRTWRTVRAGKMLVEETRQMLLDAVEGRAPSAEGREKTPLDELSFEECEEVATRMVWCKKAARSPAQEPAEGLPTVQEHQELDVTDPSEDMSLMAIRLNSCKPPKTVKIPFAQLAAPCDSTFFQTRYAPSCFDDDEMPAHLLVYRALLQLPLDVRAVCMSRIMFTGGCSNIMGLKERIFDEVSALAEEQGWDPIQGKGVEAYKSNPKLKRSRNKQTNDEPIPVITTDSGGVEGEQEVPAPVDPSNVPQELDEVEEKIRRERGINPMVQGSLRAVDTLGPWCGASLAAQLKVAALAVVDRELWLQQGVNGASKPSELDGKTQQRQSLGAGGLIRGQGGQPSSWTLGVWGAI